MVKIPPAADSQVGDHDTTSPEVPSAAMSPCLNGSDTNASTTVCHLQKNGHSNGYIEEDVDDDVHPPTPADASSTEAKTSDSSKNDQEFIFIHDTGFTVKIQSQGGEPFEIQV